MYILTLDIGGTNPRIAMMQMHSPTQFSLLYEEKANKSEPSIIPIINAFLEKCAHKKWTTNACCVSVAGAVFNNACHNPTNAQFPIDGNEIMQKTALEHVIVINDFEAIGHGVGLINPKNILQIPMTDGSKAAVDTNGVRAVIGPGTGLGVSFLTPTASGYAVHHSEAGHAGFQTPPGFATLLEFLRNKLNVSQIGAEAFVSGQAIRHLTHFFITHPENFKHILDLRPDLKQKLLANDPKGIHISDNALQDILQFEKESPKMVDAARIIAQNVKHNSKGHAALHIFMEFLGYAAQNVALTFVPTGGLYLAGGILPKHKEVLMQGEFARAFYDNWKPNMRELLGKIPIFLVDDYNISYYGAARAAVLAFGREIHQQKVA